MDRWSKIDEMLDALEKRLSRDQRILELNSFPYILQNGRWLDKRGLVSVSAVTVTELGYLVGITSTYQNHKLGESL